MGGRNHKQTRRSSLVAGRGGAAAASLLIGYVIVLLQLKLKPSAAFAPRTIAEVRRRSRRTASGAIGALQMKLKAKEEGSGNSPSSNLFVDRSCSGCGTCRSMCPGVFGSFGLRSIVQREPLDEQETRRAYQAMVTCPAGAIRLRKPDPLVKDVIEHDFPLLLDGEALPGIYHLGYHSKESLGTIPYLIVRPEGKGNIMIDAPRFNGRLARQIEKLGGIAYNIITHDGAAPDHDYWHAYFPASERIVHRMDVTRQMREEVEAVLNGKGPWTIDDDVKIIGLPGYTSGSIGVLYRPPPPPLQDNDAAAETASGSTSASAGVLFSGRTIGWSAKLNQLDGFAQFSQGNLAKQAESIRRLAEEDFAWILPAEGIKYQFPSPHYKAAVLQETAQRFLTRGRVGGLSM